MNVLTFVIDIDDTISTTLVDNNGNRDYSKSIPISKTIDKIRELKKNGHKIVLFTARGMRTFNNNVSDIKKFHKKPLIKWLTENKVPYDDLIFGKPWYKNVFYVDDKNLSIREFVNYNEDNYFNIINDNGKT